MTDIAKTSPGGGSSKPDSGWRLPHFRIFGAIVLATGLILSLIAAMNLKGNVDNLTAKKIPAIEHQVDQLPSH